MKEFGNYGVFFSCICPDGLETTVREAIVPVRGVALAPEDTQVRRSVVFTNESNGTDTTLEGVEVKGFALDTRVLEKAAERIVLTGVMESPNKPVFLHEEPAEIVFNKEVPQQ